MGLAGPGCSLLCDCEFGTCNVTANSEAELCNCARGYEGTKCDRVVNSCGKREREREKEIN